MHRPVGAATVVSSEIVDTGRISHVHGVMLTADFEGFVCDLEIEFGVLRAPGADELPTQAERLTEPVTTLIETAEVAPSLEIGERWLLLRFSGGPREGRWHQLAGEPLFLRLSDSGALLALAAEARDDPDGFAESQWLDEIEGHQAQDQGNSVTP